MEYSNQYNLKILGLPQANVKETAEETEQICLRFFKELGAKVNEQDIDIAHRLQNRDTSKPAVISCKFTCRIAKEAVMSKRKSINNINLQNVVPFMEPSDKATLAIFDHLTPKKQELLKQSKLVQKENGFAFCWVKHNTILMIESAQSRIIKINNLADLDKVKSFSTGNSWMFPATPDPLAFGGRGRGGRGRGGRGGTRVGTRSSTYS